MAYLRAATVLFKQEKFAKAALGYETLTDIFPEGQYAPLAAYNTAVCYQEIEDWHGAIGSYVRFVADYPDHENAQGLWLQVAGLYQDELGDSPQAVEAYEHALEAGDVAAAEVRYRQGECHEKDGQMDAALGSYEAATSAGSSADPFRIASLARLAEVSEERGDWTGALDYWQAIADSGGKPEWVQMATGRMAEFQRDQGFRCGWELMGGFAFW